MEKNMQGNRNHPLIAAILWTCFLTLVAVAVYLSFQDGEEAKALGAAETIVCGQRGRSARDF